ncbi:acyl-CoA thioesterase [Sansalvadorimonas sp. 2012CJ34-2]|uniref:Acyl-CoA thioesterase n=1 Tax=Parendozoicomonas callyspongiae TaxID=2942213 RepID=A0ABT0PHQ9_9GAMM|nr:acyl-CoA thioesterase [Sansalvadorimonas sp. 2012CJ34-2]MCL6270536.1 acyl-CoA thioesterase [Sansalvadorimonas sp. 2012CJ34-2]
MSAPRGELSLRTLAMPADTNPNGDIFGGWLLSQMDIAGGLAAKDCSGHRVATVAIESMCFHKPVKVGDVVCCHTEIIKIGRTSMRIKIEVWTKGYPCPDRFKVTEGIFTYVAIDDEGNAVPVKGG